MFKHRIWPEPLLRQQGMMVAYLGQRFFQIGPLLKPKIRQACLLSCRDWVIERSGLSLRVCCCYPWDVHMCAIIQQAPLC